MLLDYLRENYSCIHLYIKDALVETISFDLISPLNPRSYLGLDSGNDFAFICKVDPSIRFILPMYALNYIYQNNVLNSDVEIDMTDLNLIYNGYTKAVLCGDVPSNNSYIALRGLIKLLYSGSLVVDYTSDDHYLISQAKNSVLKYLYSRLVHKDISVPTNVISISYNEDLWIQNGYTDLTRKCFNFVMQTKTRIHIFSLSSFIRKVELPHNLSSMHWKVISNIINNL